MFHSQKSNSSKLNNITPKDTIVNVSSTLDAKSGKKNLLDGSEETCWSSAQTLPQSISLTFPLLLAATHLSLTFQGGFSSTSVGIYLTTERPGKQIEEITLEPVFGGNIFPSDKNGRQVFEIPVPEAVSPPTSPVRDETLGQQQGLVQALSGSGSRDGEGLRIAQAGVEAGEKAGPEQAWIKQIKLVFEKSADPWGRIVVYDLQILG